jgi:F-box/leucine-rich repeat protein 2/20
VVQICSLCLDSCSGITDRGLFLVASCCPNLKVISLFKCNISDSTGLEALANASSALKDVNLSYCALVSDHGLKALAQGCRQLRAVRMSYCQKISGVGYRGCSSTLAYMEAECCKFFLKKNLYVLHEYLKSCMGTLACRCCIA